MKHELAIFDMDGTALDTTADIADSVNYSLAELGLPPRDAEWVKAACGWGSKVLMRRCVPEECSDEIALKAAEIFIPYYREHSGIKTKPYEGIPEAIRELRAAGVKTAMLTNKPHLAALKLTEQYFPGLFDFAMGEREAEGIRMKPAPDGLLIVMEHFGIPREKTVYIGDSEIDAATYLDNGLPGISCLWGFRSREQLIEAGATAFAERPADLPGLII